MGLSPTVQSSYGLAAALHLLGGAPVDKIAAIIGIITLH